MGVGSAYNALIRCPASAACAAAVVLAASGIIVPAATAAEIRIVLDQAYIVRVPTGTSTMVVVNPLIADVAIEAGGVMVVTGKGYGLTNLIALDRSGRTLAEHLVTVRSPTDTVVVYRGAARESYSCAPHCERRITLGDTPDFFDATLGETGNRNARAQGSQQGTTLGR
jgi:Flp pilus assembly secretin CpaC